MADYQLYDIVRYYSPEAERAGKRDRVIKRNVFLSEAQRHCSDPRTRKEGWYFEGYRKGKVIHVARKGYRGRAGKRRSRIGISGRIKLPKIRVRI